MKWSEYKMTILMGTLAVVTIIATGKMTYHSMLQQDTADAQGKTRN